MTKQASRVINRKTFAAFAAVVLYALHLLFEVPIGALPQSGQMEAYPGQVNASGEIGAGS